MLGIRFLKLDAMILGFRLVIIGMGRLHCLAQIVGVSSISNNAAAAGVQAITARVGAVPSTRGPSLILTACAFGVCFGAAVAEIAKAAFKTMSLKWLLQVQYPIKRIGSKYLADSTRSLKSGFHAFWPMKKLLCLQLLSCLCYTQMHAQLDARAHEAP